MTISLRLFRPLLAAAALALLAAAPAPAPVDGYLNQANLPHIAQWLPSPPEAGSAAEAADISAFFSTRALVNRPEGAEAAADDVYTPDRVAPRFAEALGATLTPDNAPTFFAMMRRVHKDADAMMAPIKRQVGEGGRVRPFVRFPGAPTCPITFRGIDETGSYPSGHATIGWTWALMLGELAPDRADVLDRKGVSFGQSRVICGFHWPSDIAAGRLEASVLVSRLRADPAFQKDFARAKAEIDAARGLRRPGPFPAALDFLKRKAGRSGKP